jgi:4-hydroxy-3-polyprenylbenzoate decarboxylase
VICNDLREWIDLLRSSGELAEVDAEVDPYLEITEIADRTMKAGGPALLFRNVRGSRHPLLINQFGTERRMCLALGVEQLDDVGRKVSDVLEMQPPSGLMDKVRGLQKLKSIADARAHTVRHGPVHEIVLQGDDIDLGLLPVQRCWPGDPAPFVTLPAVITRDPRNGTRNVGMYRMQVIDRRTTFMHWQIHKDGRADWLATDGRIPVAVGAPDTPTPPGIFYVTDKLPGVEFGSYYGCCILALSGRQPNLPEGWSGGDRLAIHGSPTPTWGRAVSNGCLHAAEPDLRYLMKTVPLGTAVRIHA